MTRNVPKVVILSSCGDWEALYINGDCVFQDHEIRRHNLLEFAENYGFTSTEIIYADASSDDEDESETTGCFPNRLEDLKDTSEIFVQWQTQQKQKKTKEIVDQKISEGKPVRLTKKQKRVQAFVEYIQEYWNTYPNQSSYLDYDDPVLINDALYAIGVALDKTEYSWRTGFDKFKKFLKEEGYLDTLEEVDWEEVIKEPKSDTDGKIF